MMKSSRARSIFSVIAIISFLISVYICWTLTTKTTEHSSFYITLVITAVSSFNIAILSGWIGFGMMGGSLITVCASLFVLLLGFRMGCYGHNVLILTYFVTAWIGYLFTNSKNRLDQLYVLRSERVEEEINILANEVKEKNKGIKVFEEKLMRYSTLKNVAESLSAALSLDSISDLIVDKTRKILGKSGRILLFLVNPDAQELMLSSSSARNYPVIKTKKGDVFDNWALRNRKPLMIEDVAKDFRFPANSIDKAADVFRSLIEVPLVSENKVIGVLRMDSQQEFAYTQDDLRLLDIIANLGAVAIQNSVLYSKTQELAIRDGLTGLKVRRFFMESFHREVKRASRKREQLSFLILDIDHFKDYNDKYGHASGDLILKFIAKTISDQLEGPDVASRYGGEELALLLWKKSKKEARLKADKIRQLVKKRPLTLRKHEANVTVSIGVSTFPEDGATEEELIRAADLRLYRAKAAGRDRVCSD